VIRNVVLGRLRPDASPALLDQALAALSGVAVDGLLELRVGRDAGLRAGNWDYAITVDLADADAYRRYDQDDEHDRIRRELLGPLCSEIARVQIAV
jgi:hypothetical protein